MHLTSLLHIAGLSRLSSISCPTHHVVYIEKLSAQHFVSGVLLPHPLYTTAAPRLERVTSTRLVVAPTIPTLLGNRFNLYFACHHYLQRGNFGMPPITRRLRGLFRLLPFPVISRVRFGVNPCRLVIVLLGFADLRLFFLPGQKFRLLAMVRTGVIPIRAALTGAAAVASDCCYHFSITIKGATGADDFEQASSIFVLQYEIGSKAKRCIPNMTLKENKSRYITFDGNANLLRSFAVVFKQRRDFSAFFP